MLRKKIPYFSTICNKKIFNIYNHIALYLFAYIRGTILFIKIVFLIVQFNPKGYEYSNRRNYENKRKNCKAKGANQKKSGNGRNYFGGVSNDGVVFAETGSAIGRKHGQTRAAFRVGRTKAR